MANIEKRKSKEGKTTYRVKVRIKGAPAQSATFVSLTKAKEWAAKIETEINEGKNFGHFESKKHTTASSISMAKSSILPMYFLNLSATAESISFSSAITSSLCHTAY
ncbi:MAG: hypothetical protein LBH41_00810, partial [Rickettsiales bacterium]|nr:hypothetical protein [Rickettsiales bacterium]